MHLEAVATQTTKIAIAFVHSLLLLNVRQHKSKRTYTQITLQPCSHVHTTLPAPTTPASYRYLAIALKAR